MEDSAVAKKLFLPVYVPHSHTHSSRSGHGELHVVTILGVPSSHCNISSVCCIDAWRHRHFPLQNLHIKKLAISDWLMASDWLEINCVSAGTDSFTARFGVLFLRCCFSPSFAFCTNHSLLDWNIFRWMVSSFPGIADAATKWFDLR